MIKIGIIGSGNVAVHLAKAFSASREISFAGILARDPKKIRPYFNGPFADSANEFINCDLILIAVADDAIASVARQLPFKEKLVAHTSGSRPLSDIGTANKSASFYPLQTFSLAKDLDYSAIPVCIEAGFEADYAVLEVAASVLGETRRLDSAQRRALHLSAVFACNFSNHMYVLAHRICREHNVPFSMLNPLIVETAQKITQISPIRAQTGPARRADAGTISAHLEMLEDNQIKNLYRDITESIQYEAQKL